MRHYNTYNLRSSILQKLDKTFLGEISVLDEHAAKFAIDKLFTPARMKQYQLRNQRKYRKRTAKKIINKITRKEK